MNRHPRVKREAKTIQAMFRLFCQSKHGITAGLCSSCQELEEYALQRLDHCPFQERKTTCAKCPIHCFRTDMRVQIREVMRYAGPRMLIHHPWLSIFHLFDGLREKPKPKSSAG